MTDTFTTGCRVTRFHDAVQGADIPLVLMYPARAQLTPRTFGPYEMTAAWDAPPAGEALPLVVISHGNTGSPWTLRDLGASLARAGFAVALPEHVGNSRNDASLTGTLANLQNRPRHVSLAIDAAKADAQLGPHIGTRQAGVVGLSIGGYTALAAAGGEPWTGPQESPAGPHPVPVTHDARIGALVLLAPATFWFMAEAALRGVTQPILILSGGADTVAPIVHAEVVLNGVPDPSRVQHEVVPGAGHFSFLSPFPPALTRPDFPPSQDPPGFDRAAFQPQLAEQVTRFLRQHL